MKNFVKALVVALLLFAVSWKVEARTGRQIAQITISGRSFRILDNEPAIGIVNTLRAVRNILRDLVARYAETHEILNNAVAFTNRIEQAFFANEFLRLPATANNQQTVDMEILIGDIRDLVIRGRNRLNAPAPVNPVVNFCIPRSLRAGGGKKSVEVGSAALGVHGRVEHSEQLQV